ncbi:MAG: hypothetical protein M0Q93_04090 [Terrimicrobiaceae bacterium]|nr:hypothetical protein [Terrimicrobiaceae bacterium]
MLRAELPCGQVIYLRQSKTDPNAYQTPNKQMAAVIDKEKGDITLVGSCCGEYRCRQGRLYQIKSTDGRLITLTYNGNLVTEIREEGSAITPFKLVTTSGGVPTGMYVNGKLHTFELGKKPRVENTNGTNVIAGFDPSLALWKFPDGKQETYQFEVGQDVSPNLKMTDRDNAESNYVWDGATGHIVSDGEWTYTVGKMAGPFDLPKLDRVNSKGEEEFRYVDTAKGITEVKNLRRGHTITETFLSSGPLYGKVRKIEKVEDGVKQLIYQAGYSESGQLLRKTDENGFTTIISYGAAGKLKGTKVLPTRDPQILKNLKLKEESLVATLAAAAPGEKHDEAAQALAFFYIHKMKDVAKALPLAAIVQDRQILFNIKAHAVDHDPNATPEEKLSGYKLLLIEFPEQQQILNASIQTRKREYETTVQNN